MKNNFDRRIKEEQFQIDDLVLKWDAPKEDKHGKFDHNDADNAIMPSASET